MVTQAEHDAAHQWADRALEWSHVAGNPLQTSIALARKSQLAGDSGDGATALDYAMAVARSAPPDSRLPALAEVCAAHGHALLGDADESSRAFDRSRELISSLELEAGAAWGGWLDSAYIDAQQARGQSALGQHLVATDLFDSALERIPHSYPRDRGVYLARSARSVAKAGEFDRAADLGSQALEAGQVMKSGRIKSELRLLLTDFEGTETDSVNGFRELAHSANVA